MYQNLTQIIVEKHDKILVIKFYNPKKKNCVNSTAYTELGRTFREVAQDETVSIVVITGEGEFFTAGNDLTQNDNVSDFDAHIRESNTIFKEMVSSVIDCPQIVISLVNGPSIGIGTTLAALSDMVWVSETAYFLAPFTKLGIVPEACSSFLFPLIIGRSKTTEMLLFGEKMSAEAAYRYNFASRIFKLSELNTVIWPKIKEYSETLPGSLRASKQLIRMHERESLYKALNAECDELLNRFYTEEFINAVIAFSMRKSKAKL